MEQGWIAIALSNDQSAPSEDVQLPSSDPLVANQNTGAARR
jgi:hypothetical protein